MVEFDPSEPGPGEALVRHTAIGLNFIDTYHRTGLYPVDLPCGLGIEAAGVVEAVGGDLTEAAGFARVNPSDRQRDAGGDDELTHLLDAYD